MTLDEELFPVITSSPELETLHSPNYEKIIELDPDLIIVSYLFNEEIEKNLSSYFPVVRLVFDNTEDITALGAVLDKEAEAADYVNWIKSYTDKIDERIAKLDDSELPKVFIYYEGEKGMSPPSSSLRDLWK